MSLPPTTGLGCNVLATVCIQLLANNISNSTLLFHNNPQIVGNLLVYWVVLVAVIKLNILKFNNSTTKNSIQVYGSVTYL